MICVQQLDFRTAPAPDTSALHPVTKAFGDAGQ